MKVLVIDDHALVRDALRGVLKELRAETSVVEASDWHQAARAGSVTARYDRNLNPLRSRNVVYEPAYTRFSFPLARERKPPYEHSVRYHRGPAWSDLGSRARCGPADFGCWQSNGAVYWRGAPIAGATVTLWAASAGAPLIGPARQP